MSDGAISQDEIDALLSGVDMGGLSSGSFSSSPSSSSKIDIPTLQKFYGDTVSTLKSSLDGMSGASFDVGAPTVEVANREDLLQKLPEMVVSVITDYNETLVGDHTFIMAPEFAQKLSALINHEDAPEIDDFVLSLVSEVMSQHSGSEITTLCAGGRLAGLASDPADAKHTPKALVRYPTGNFALITYPISVEGSAYSLWELVGEEPANGIAAALGGGSQPEASSSGGLSPQEMQSMASMSAPMGGAAMGGMGGGMGMQMGGAMGGMAGMNQMGAPMGGMGMQMGGMPMGGMPMGGMQMGGMGAMPMGGMGMPGAQMGGMPQQIPNVQQLQYPSLAATQSGAEQGNISLIMDVYMEMTVELGRTQKPIKEILGMGEGTIIELDKLAGESVDILVNHKPIACGEVVVIDENFGVRVTKILSPMERVADLH